MKNLIITLSVLTMLVGCGSRGVDNHLKTKIPHSTKARLKSKDYNKSLDELDEIDRYMVISYIAKFENDGSKLPKNFNIQNAIDAQVVEQTKILENFTKELKNWEW